MDDYVLLFLVLAGIYLVECFFLVERGTVILYSRWLKKREYALLESVPHFAGRILFLCNPLPPLGENFSSTLPCVAVSPEGAACSGSHVLFGDMKTVSRDDKTVIVNGTVFSRCASAAGARRVCAQLRDLAGVPQPEREKKIRGMIAAAFDVDGAKSAYDEFRKRSLAPRIFSNALFILLFACAPVAAYLNLVLKGLAALLLLLVVLMGMVLGAFYFSHRALYGNERGERWSEIFSMLFSPPLAIRSVDYLSKNLFERYHPVAAARVVMDPEGFRKFSHVIMRRLILPAPGGLPGPAERISAWHDRAILDAIGRRFGRELREDDALYPPAQDGESILSYCPRCHAQYTVAGGWCSDCRFPLERYPEKEGE